MKRSFVYSSFLLLIVIFGCGVPKSEYEKLKAENQKLKSELDDCANGADKLAAKAKKAYSESNYSEAKTNIEDLLRKHPEYPQINELQKLLKDIDKKINEEEAKKEAEEKERIRLSNLNNLGMWEVAYYVDNFGDPTNKAYIRNENIITGTFSNTATQNSDLNVVLLITNSSDIAIELFEYAGNNPVKAISSDSYTIRVKDKDGNKYNLSAVNYSDRLELNRSNSRKLHNIFLKGGEVQFWIQEDETPTTQYNFTIVNADWYENAYTKLTSKQL